MGARARNGEIGTRDDGGGQGGRGMLDGGFDAVLGTPDTARSEAHAAVVQHAHGDLEALAHPADHVLDGHF